MEFKVLITGANRGLGLALTEKLLDEGHVVHAIIRHESPGLLRLLHGYPANLRLYIGDVSDEDSIRMALEKIRSATQTLDILLNNAAVGLEQGLPLLEQLDFSTYLPMFQVNALGPLLVAKYALPLLRHGNGKLIVNFSSEAGSIGDSDRTSDYGYCMSKAALNMASKIMQNDLKKDRIKVLSLHPGWFSSDMGGPDAPITPADAADKIVKLILNPPGLNGPIFVSSDGEEMEW